MKCNIKLIKDGKVPVKKHVDDACYDMYAREVNKIHDDLYEVKLGCAMSPPRGWRVAIYPRSSISKTGWILANSVGVGDNNYTGEYMAYFARYNSKYIPGGPAVMGGRGRKGRTIGKDFPYEVGDRCVQMELVEYTRIDFNVVDDLDDTTRGTGGFGSTNK